MPKKYKEGYVIIGAGNAGVNAAEEIRRLDQKTPIYLIDNDLDGFYYRSALKYLIKGKITESQLQARPKNHFENRKITIINQKINSIDLENKRVGWNGNSIPFIKLLLATGGIPIIPNIPGKNLQNVQVMRTLEDTRKIIKIATTGQYRKCVVVGAGVLGTELSEALVELGTSVELFTLDPTLVPKMLDTKTSKLVDSLFKKNGIEIHYQEGISKILDDGEGKAQGVETQNGKIIQADGIFICIGISPNTSLAELIGLELEKGIKVNQFLQTSNPNIYAAGDVASIFDTNNGASTHMELWGSAGDMGKQAGNNMVTTPAPIELGANHAYTIFWKHNFHCIGNYNPTNINEYEILNRSYSFGKKEAYLKMVLKENKIKGAIVFGEAKDPMILKYIIEENIDIPSEIPREDLLKSDFDYEIIYNSGKNKRI